MHRIVMAALVGAGVVAAVVPAPAWSQQKLIACHVGQRVGLPGSGQGTVVALRGTGGCDVKADGYENVQTWAAWMLTSVGGAAAPLNKAVLPGGAPRPGNYQCFGGSAGNMKLRFGGGNSYSNEQGATGSYKFRPSGQMEFVSGPWKGFYAKTLGNGRVGLTSKPDGTFYQMTCDPR